MKNYEDVILTALKAKTYSFTTTFKKSYDYSELSFDNPLVIVEEILNDELITSTTTMNEEVIGVIGYNIQIYSGSNYLLTVAKTARECVVILSEEINNVMKDLGFKRSGNTRILPYNEDNSIMIYMYRFNGNYIN